MSGLDKRETVQPGRAHDPQVGGGAEHDHQGLGGQVPGAGSAQPPAGPRDARHERRPRQA